MLSRTLISCFAVLCCASSLVFSSDAGGTVDIARFGSVRAWIGKPTKFTGCDIVLPTELKRTGGVWAATAAHGETSANIGLEWDEPRDPRTITVVYADAASAPTADTQELQLWLNPERIPPEGADSPLQGKWAPLAKSDGFRYESDSLKWTYYLPKLKTGIFKFRIVLKNKTVARVKSLSAETDAKWRPTQFEVRFDPPRKNPKNEIEGYNAEVTRIQPMKGCDGFRVDGLASDASSRSYDRAIFTVRAGDRSFSFLTNDLIDGGEIAVKPFGATVTRPGAQAAGNQGKTVIERVLEMPEQTFDGALTNVPKKKRNKFLALAPPLNYCKFAVRPNGDIFTRDEWDMNYRTATGDKPDYNRAEPQHVEDGYLPVIYAEWQDQGLDWEQGYVVTTTNGAALDSLTAGTMMVTRISATNHTQAPVSAKLWLCLAGGNDVCQSPTVRDGAIYEHNRLRARLTKGDWNAQPIDSQLLFTASIAPGENRSLEIEIPYHRGDSLPPRVGFDAARKQNIDFWKAKLAGGADFVVPDDRINALWKSLLIHQYTWGDYQADKGWAIPNVAAFSYGACGNESSQMAKALDFYGHQMMAGEYFDPMWKAQGSRDVPAMATNGRGCMPGWWGGYVFNTGFEVWNICNHYRLTGDRKWFDRAIPNLITACDWIIEQRKTTIANGPDGRPLLHSGLFPASGLEDEGSFFYWTMTNAYLYCGVKSLADVLTSMGHLDGPRLTKEAAAYLHDIRRDMAEATARCPVVELRDGSYVPYLPKQMYLRGRSEGFYEAELGALHTVTTGVYGPREPQVDWTLNFLEDRVFLTEAPSHDSIISYKNMESDWYDLGGYGKTQPYLLHQQIAYLRRDQPKLFLRSFWNQLVAQAFLDVNAFPEHICWSGQADCKTYEEAMWLQQFRAMLVFDEDGVLRLSAAAPREWFADGKSISVKNAPTVFGPISYDIHSSVDSGKITAHVMLNSIQNPGVRHAGLDSASIRFRHPRELKMKSVTLNGKPWARFDAANETIDLPLDGGTVEVEASYR